MAENVIITSYRRARTGFVEGNVTILANTGEKEFDSAVRLDGSLVCVAFSDEVGCVAVEDMYLGRGDIDLRVMSAQKRRR